MLEMQERWEINQDKRALREALAEFKKNPPAHRQRPHRQGDNQGRRHLRVFVCRSGRNHPREPGCSGQKRGVTHGYTITETGPTISVTCILKFGMYDELPGATLSAGPDTSGTKKTTSRRRLPLSATLRSTPSWQRQGLAARDA